MKNACISAARVDMLKSLYLNHVHFDEADAERRSKGAVVGLTPRCEQMILYIS